MNLAAASGIAGSSYPSLEFFREIRWSEVVFEMRTHAELRVGGFPGSSLRGALGHFFRAAFCSRRPVCQNECQEPATCRFLSLFEPGMQSGGCKDATRPYLLRPPVPAELALIAAGGPVVEPYAAGRPLRAGLPPLLTAPGPLCFAPGSIVRFSLAVFGPAAALFEPMLEALGKEGLDWSGTHCSLARATDARGWERVLYDSRMPASPVRAPLTASLGDLLTAGESVVRRLRVVLETPVLIKSGQKTALEPELFGKLFFEQCLMRAMRMHDFACRAVPGRLPWVSVPSERAKLVDWRLHHYILPRRSIRQGGRDMEFDGLVGYLEFEALEGHDLSWFAALARAAEVLQVGQKTTFGLGRVSCHDL